MLTAFKNYIRENDIIKEGDKALLAVSGGIDSMVMAHLFFSLKNKTGIAHCNFSLRAGESDKDEDMVRQFSLQHNIPFHTIRFETKKFAKEHGLSVQMAARELRYKWFEDIRAEFGFDYIATAHNLNDNIETLIINLSRGTGIAGLSGMKPVSNNIIRPLLFASRIDITDYCRKNNIHFREDKSNADTKYTRNKIRHLVIPVLKEINPSIERTLSVTAERFSEVNEIVSLFINEIRAKIIRNNGASLSVNINELRTYTHNQTIVYELFKPFGLESVQVEDLLNVLDGKNGGFIATPSNRIIKNRKELIISPEDKSANAIYNIENLEELQNAPLFGSVKMVNVTEEFKIQNDNNIASLDFEKITFPLIIRGWKQGDHFHPLGMKQKKKLSDYFIDKKYSPIEKENALILESAGEIVWIIGERIDERHKVGPETSKILILKVKAQG